MFDYGLEKICLTIVFLAPSKRELQFFEFDVGYASSVASPLSVTA